MKQPYYCPYCDQVSMRKWNLSTHMQRRHKGQWDPFKMGKETVLTDSVYPTQNNNKYESFLPQFNLTDPFETMERLVKFKNLTQDLEQFSKMELYFILSKIINLLQPKCFLVGM